VDPIINHTPGIVTIADANTTIGYCRYTDDGEVEYIFVNHAHRRRGYGRTLLAIVQSTVQRTLRFQPPISPLGAALQRDYAMRRPEADLRAVTSTERAA
jgi:GNAT superfamily N-acetyltransferase